MREILARIGGVCVMRQYNEEIFLRIVLMVRYVLIILCALCLFAARPAAANDMFHADKGRVVDGAGRAVQLRCVNLSPWLNPEPYLIAPGLKAMLTSPSEFRTRLADAAGADAATEFWRQWEENFVTEDDFKTLAKAGFTCVRLPLNHRRILNAAQNGLNEAALLPVDHAVAWGEKYGIAVIIDLHTAPGGQNPLSTVSDVPSSNHDAQLWTEDAAAANQKLTANIWGWLAKRYASSRGVGGYDLLNEPALPRGADKQNLRHFYQAVIRSIRAADRDHMIVLEGDNYAHDFSMLAPPPDKNVLYQFHEYALGNADWRKPKQEGLAPFLKLREETGMPLWLGEFGENDLTWQQSVVSLLQANDIGWAVWPWKRVAIGNHPVIETITPPESWQKLGKYAARGWFAAKPSAEEARKGMADMLRAIRTENCAHDAEIEKVLAGNN